MFYRKLDSDYLDDTFNTIIKTLGEKTKMTSHMPVHRNNKHYIKMMKLELMFPTNRNMLTTNKDCLNPYGKGKCHFNILRILVFILVEPFYVKQRTKIHLQPDSSLLVT